MLGRAGLPQVAPLPLPPSLAQWVASLGLISGHSLPCPRLWIESHHQHPGASGGWVVSPLPSAQASLLCILSTFFSFFTPSPPGALLQTVLVHPLGQFVVSLLCAPDLSSLRLQCPSLGSWGGSGGQSRAQSLRAHPLRQETCLLGSPIPPSSLPEAEVGCHLVKGPKPGGSLQARCPCGWNPGVARG